MLQAHFSYNETDNALRRFSEFKDPYAGQMAVIQQLQQLVCSVASSLNFDLKVNFTTKDRVSTQEYFLVDSEGKQRLHLRHVAYAPLTRSSSLVRFPMSVAQVNQVINKVPNVCKENNEAEKFKELLSKLTHLNEEKFLIDAYEDDQQELSLTMQSKQGRQTLEVYL